MSSSDDEAHFAKAINLTNYSGTNLDLAVDRRIRLLAKDQAEEILLTSLPKAVKCLGFETENTITNTGARLRNESTAMLSIWILNMFVPSPETTIVIPFKAGSIRAFL